MSADRAHCAAVLAALTTGGLTAHDSVAPDTAAGRYVVVTTQRRFGATPRLTSRSVDDGWRVVVLCVGSTVNEARWVMEKAAAALEFRRPAVSGASCTPVRFESSRPAQTDPDDPAVCSGTSVWTYAATLAA